jgi:hypothetical protein
VDIMGDSTGHEPAESEREVLLFFLNKMRDAVVRISEGLTDDQVRMPGVPSGTNVLGLILCVPTTLSTALTRRVALPASGRDDHRSCACGSRSS